MSKDYRWEQGMLLRECRKIARWVERKTESDFDPVRAMDWGLTMEQIAALVEAGVPVRRVAECYPWSTDALTEAHVLKMLVDEDVAFTQTFANTSSAEGIQFRTRKTVYVLCTWVNDDGELQMGLAQVAWESERWLAWCHGSTEGNDRGVDLMVLRAIKQQEIPREFRWCILDGDGWPVVAAERLPPKFATATVAALAAILPYDEEADDRWGQSHPSPESEAIGEPIEEGGAVNKETEKRKVVTAQDAADLLNELLALDRRAVIGLLRSRVRCNAAISAHPTVVVKPGRGVDRVGLLGVLNGLFRESNGTGELVRATYDAGVLVGFDVARPSLMGLTLGYDWGLVAKSTHEPGLGGSEP